MSARLDGRSTCALLLASFVAFAGCAPSEEDFEDLGAITDGKSDGPPIIDRELILPAATSAHPGSARRRVHATADFQVELAYDGMASTRIRVRPNGKAAAEVQSAHAVGSSLVVRSTGASYYDIYMENESPVKLPVRLTARTLTVPSPDARFTVLFTAPQCPAIPEKSIPAGAHCSSGPPALTDELNASRAAAGIADHLLAWIDETRAAKDAHPERDMKITMAFLTWSDGRYYDAICRATAAGVKLEGYFDSATAGTQPPRIAADPACKPENITIKYAGGKTTGAEWRLMHVKMMLFDTGEPRVRLVFGSANLSSFATALHFENWVFAELASHSHFVESHRCAARALAADAYDAQGNYANVFQDSYDACVADLAERGIRPDPRYRVFFSPTRERSGVTAAMAAMREAKGSVGMAIQHFDDQELGEAFAANGRTAGLSARLVVDDDTFYGNGEGSAAGDQYLYEDILKPAGVQTHFMQTTDALHQYQHNKYIVIDRLRVFCGAGNFSGAAFQDNYENFYLLDDAAVAGQYADHFERMWGIAQPESALPADYNF